MRDIKTPGDLELVSGGDPIVGWAAQGFGAGVRCWYDGNSVAVASSDVSKHDRLAVIGRVDEHLGYTYRRVAAASVRP